MEKTKESLNSLRSTWIKQMQIIKDKTGIKGLYVIIVLFISIIFVYMNIFEKLITNLVGTVYPAFYTIKSIESKTEDNKLWLCYWIVFISFSLFDIFSPLIIRLFPLYFLFKIVFLIWLFMPNSFGCTYVYNLIIKQIFQSYESNLDLAADTVKQYTKEYLFTKKNKQAIKDIAKNIDVEKVMKPFMEGNKTEHIS